VKKFKRILKSERIIIDEDDVEEKNVEWLGMVRGERKIVLKKKNKEEV
jgi:hypothetical protein